MGAEDSRAHYVERLKQRLTQRGNPYGQMFLILSLTGLIGFLASVALHRIGLAHMMGLRYLLSVMAAYAAFLALLGIWLAINRRRQPRESPTVVAHGDDVAQAVLWADPGGVPDLSVAAVEAATDRGSGGIELPSIGKIGDVSDGEGALLVVVLVIVVAVLAALFVSVWNLFDAPILLAELLVDGALVAGLAKRLRASSGQHWALTAMRRTIVPFLITGAAFGLVGFGLQYFVPGATTMLEALRMATW